MRIGERTYNVKLGLTIFLAITIVSIMIILYLDVDKGTWQGFKKVKPEYGLIAGMLMLTQWLLNGLRFQILINSFKEKISFRTSFSAFMANMFMSAMTPSQTGGGPLQIFILNRAGVPFAKAFAGCLMGAVLTVVCLVFSSAGIFLFKPELRAGFGHQMGAVLSIVFIIFLLLTILFFLSLFRIKLVKHFIGKLMLFILHIIKVKRRLAITRRIMHGLDQYSECMQIFAGTKKHRVLVAGLITILAMSTNFFIAPFLLMGLNVYQDFLQIFLVQFIIGFIVYFSPTPGASGIAEFSSYWIMESVNIDQRLLGIYTVVWRFFTSFIGVGVGAIIVLGMLRSWKKRDRISDQE